MQKSHSIHQCQLAQLAIPVGRRYQSRPNWHQILFSVQTWTGGKFYFQRKLKRNTYGRLCHHFRHCLLAKFKV